jgi:phytol kinase
VLEPILGPITPIDLAITLLLNQAIFIILFIAIFLTKNNYPRWIPRKLIHISISTTIGVVIPHFSNFSAVLLTLGLFITLIIIAVSVGLGFKSDILESSRRENENHFSTFLSPFVVIAGFGILLVLSGNRPEIFAAGVLVLGWGDGAGEIIGRLFGRTKYTIYGSVKSLEGSLGVMVFSVMAIWISYLMYNPHLLLNTFLLSAFGIALVISIVEGFSRGWVDNILLPLLTGLLLIFLGL